MEHGGIYLTEYCQQKPATGCMCLVSTDKHCKLLICRPFHNFRESSSWLKSSYFTLVVKNFTLNLNCIQWDWLEIRGLTRQVETFLFCQSTTWSFSWRMFLKWKGSEKLRLPSVGLVYVDDVSQTQRWNTGIEQSLLQGTKKIKNEKVTRISLVSRYFTACYALILVKKINLTRIEPFNS